MTPEYQKLHFGTQSQDYNNDLASHYKQLPTDLLTTASVDSNTFTLFGNVDMEMPILKVMYYNEVKPKAQQPTSLIYAYRIKPSLPRSLGLLT